ncbi:MAG: hypothetical protein PUD92_02470 [Clostridiales bacterium]|nr:hypothetical protein [Clostridiales bacterium]
MFKILKRKFYFVIIVIAVLLFAITVSAYFVIDKALTDDYTAKTNDIARKVINDFRIKTDYIESLACFFAEGLNDKTDHSGTAFEDAFKTDVNKIKIYNSDIDGAGVFRNNGYKAVTNSRYLRAEQELCGMLDNGDENVWAALKSDSGNTSNLFLLLPLNNDGTKQSGIVMLEVTSLKKGLKADNIFMQNTEVYFETAKDRLYILETDHAEKKRDKNININEEIQPGLNMAVNISMRGLRDQLNKVKLYMIIFYFMFLMLAAVVVHRTVKKIVNDLTDLKKDIDDYALSK